jgi:prepilin-type N-terminal cleavage/methylation domain-containing protein
MKTNRFTAAFTLIELLIVVAIIAILAAIAVPNFLEAQTRAKISRARADLRTIHTGLEMYQIDNNSIPLMNGINAAIDLDDRAGTKQYQRTLERLTSPIAYLTGRSVFSDPFPAKAARGIGRPDSVPKNESERRAYSEYFYAVRGLINGGNGLAQHLQWGDNARPQWALLQSSGPQLKKWWFGTEVNSYLAADTPKTRGVANDMMYNPTNGTVSAGTILRVVGQPTGRGAVVGHVAQQAWN